MNINKIQESIYNIRRMFITKFVCEYKKNYLFS